MEEFKTTKTLALQGIEPNGGGGALSSDVSKLGSKEVSKKLRNFPLAIKKACHCEDERSEDVAIAKSLNINEITTQSSIARNDNNRNPELVSASQTQERGESSRKIAFTKPSRGTSEARDEQESTGTLSSRCDCERCRLMRGAVARKSRKIAFTLAEVLITLGVIGVVASLTLPSVIMNYQKKQTVVELKKVYAELQNAIKLSEIDNGPMSEWDYPEKNSYVDPVSSTSFIKKYYLPYFKDAKFVDSSYFNSGYCMLNAIPNNFTNYIILDNGVILSFYANVFAGYIWLFIDLNGTQGPNRAGRDVFVFDAYKYSNLSKNPYKLKFWSAHYDDTFQGLTQADWYGCNKNNTHTLRNFYCGRLIELNNWEIPKDYPW